MSKEEEKPRREILRSVPAGERRLRGYPSEEEFKLLYEKSEGKLSLKMAECPNLDEFAAKHGRTTIIWGYGRYQFSDPAIGNWAKRVSQVMFDDELLTIAEEQYLTGEELEAARKARENGTRHE